MSQRKAARSLPEFIEVLRREHELVEISCEVDPYLEVAEIHRRIIDRGGPALLFTRVKGADFPLVTNLFGTTRRVDLAFGGRPEELMREIASLPHTMMPPNLSAVWQNRRTLLDLARVGLSRRRFDTSMIVDTPPRLGRLPMLTTWPLDGGPFVTLPLVYTEHPETHVHNLGMYRIQRYDDRPSLPDREGWGIPPCSCQGAWRATTRQYRHRWAASAHTVSDCTPSRKCARAAPCVTSRRSSDAPH
jgi:UbiD family decarboxylase